MPHPQPFSVKTYLATAVTAAFAAALFALASPPALNIDGQRIASDVPPVTTANRAFVPLRAVSESLGAKTHFDAKSHEIVVARGHDVLRMRLGDKIATLNGNRMTLKTAPFTVRGRTMVSLAAVRALGSKVNYDTAKARIDVLTPGVADLAAEADN